MCRLLLATSLVACVVCVAYGRHPELLLPMSSKPACQGRNLKLSRFIHARADETGENLLPHLAEDFDSFVLEVKQALDRHMLSERAVDFVFSDKAEFSPTCSGLWAEFGVASGGTVNTAAKFRKNHCSQSCPPVHGFDTFTGLPEKWVRDDQNQWEENAFNQNGYPPVEPNVNLVKGLFNESLPEFLKQLATLGYTDEVVSYLHIDCDLYAGSRDALTLLAPMLTVGTVIIFDDLVNYQYFRDHEIKAMWEWITATGTRLLPIGIKGPLPGKSYAVELDWSGGEGAADWYQQSAAFVIAQQNPPQQWT